LAVYSEMALKASSNLLLIAEYFNFHEKVLIRFGFPLQITVKTAQAFLPRVNE